jgi:phage-related tail fiber protein
MAGTNDFKVFCTATPGTSDSLTPAAYALLTSILANGFQTGVADSQQANTVLRQATTAMAVLGELISRANLNAVDNANYSTLATQLLQAIKTLVPSSVAGDMKISASPFVPSGWLSCDGSSLLRSAYPALFTAIGTIYGTADANHFNIPDMRGMFPRGYDAGRGVDPGHQFGYYQADQMPAHVHIVDLQPLNSNSFGGSGKVTTGNDPAEGVIPPFNTSSTGIGTETRVKNLALSFFIYLGM